MGWENPHGILGLVAAREGAVPLCCPTLPSPPAALAARSARLVFHTADTCTQRGQPRAHTRAALLGANALAAGPQAVVPPRALLAPGWEEQSRSDVLSVATSPGDVCWAQGAAGCRGPHGKHAPPLTLPRAAPGSLLQPGLCAAASMTAGAPGAAQNSCPHSPPLPGRRQLSHDSVLRPGAAGGSCHPAAVLSPLPVGCWLWGTPGWDQHHPQDRVPLCPQMGRAVPVPILTVPPACSTRGPCSCLSATSLAVFSGGLCTLCRSLGTVPSPVSSAPRGSEEERDAARPAGPACSVLPCVTQGFRFLMGHGANSHTAPPPHHASEPC